MSIEMVILASLLTWRLSSMLVRERGPGDVFGKVRDFVGIGWDEYSKPIAQNELAELFLCMFCMTIWIGWGVALLFAQPYWFMMGFIYSAGALMTERIAHG